MLMTRLCSDIKWLCLVRTIKQAYYEWNVVSHHEIMGDGASMGQSSQA